MVVENFLRSKNHSGGSPRVVQVWVPNGTCPLHMAAEPTLKFVFKGSIKVGCLICKCTSSQTQANSTLTVDAESTWLVMPQCSLT